MQGLGLYLRDARNIPLIFMELLEVRTKVKILLFLGGLVQIMFRGTAKFNLYLGLQASDLGVQVLVSTGSPRGSRRLFF